jgi:hypothetical protein
MGTAPCGSQECRSRSTAPCGSSLERWLSSDHDGTVTHLYPGSRLSAASQLRHQWCSGKPQEHRGVAASRESTDDPCREKVKEVPSVPLEYKSKAALSTSITRSSLAYHGHNPRLIPALRSGITARVQLSSVTLSRIGEDVRCSKLNSGECRRALIKRDAEVVGHEASRREKISSAIEHIPSGMPRS